MIDVKQERAALWMLFGLLSLTVTGACAAIVLLGLALGQIAEWVLG